MCDVGLLSQKKFEVSFSIRLWFSKFLTAWCLAFAHPNYPIEKEVYSIECIITLARIKAYFEKGSIETDAIDKQFVLDLLKIHNQVCSTCILAGNAAWFCYFWL